MRVSTLLLLLTAGLLHASWNVLVKQARQKEVFLWWAWWVGGLGALPLLVVLPAVPRAAWPYVLVSGLAQAGYSLALTRAYALADFSQAYPLARGAAPALLAVWAALFLGERPTGYGIVGMTLLLLGLLTVSGLFGRVRQPVGRAVLAAALGVALAISIYSVIDGAAVQIASPLPYTIIEFVITALVLTPVLLWRYPPAVLLGEWRANWRRILAVGVLILLTYAMVLAAYSAGRVGYAGAIREVSVVFAALIGWRWLGEGFGRVRLVGALLIFAGIVMIAVAG